ncbi:MAG TPA: beta-galactosidase [Kofleriaceae bacterium]|nr:beta-galactosidase [Kofleriaceae bacterium]
MDARRRTWFDDRGLAIAQGDAPARQLAVYAGALHYWRVDPAAWPRCLRAMRDLGLTLVETWVPWRVHEPAPGQLAWDRGRDLPRFLAAAHDAGLGVILRPGPHVGGDVTSGGFPDHVVGDPAVQARSAAGTPVWLPAPPRAFPVPSYASAAFRDRARAWLTAFAEVVRPHLAPDGPVVALGVDHAAQMFFRLGAFDHDYHPDAIAAWRETTGLDGDPPTAWDPSQAARGIAWLRFRDHYLGHALADFARTLDAAGLAGIARCHDLPGAPHPYGDLRGLQAAIAGPVGTAVYSARADFRALRERALAVVGDAAPVPLALDVALGGSPWLPPLDRADANDPHRERDQLLSVLAAGVRGFNLAMLVERERHFGAALDHAGKLAPHAAWLPPLLASLVAVDWPALRRAAPIAVIASRADERFAQASSLVDPAAPVIAEWLGLGPGGAASLARDPVGATHRRWLAAVTRALDLARVPFVIVDEAASAAELAGFRAVIAPTLQRIDRGLAHTLRALAEHKRAVVVIGPGTPSHDELGQPIADPHALPRRVGRLKAGSLDDVPGLAADLAALAGALDDAWQIERPDDVHAYAHGDRAGAIRVVFVASDAAAPASAVLRVDATARALRDPFSHERIPAAAGRATISVPARGVRMLVVER